TPTPGSPALDAATAENPLRAHHQHQDHQHIRREILGPATDIRVEVSGGQVLDNPDDETADHRTHDRIEPAEDHYRKDLEADQRQLVVDAEHRPPDDAAQGRDDPRHR